MFFGLGSILDLEFRLLAERGGEFVELPRDIRFEAGRLLPAGRQRRLRTLLQLAQRGSRQRRGCLQR